MYNNKRNETKFGETEKETLSVRFAKIIETNKMPKSAVSHKLYFEQGIMTETRLQAERHLKIRNKT